MSAGWLFPIGEAYSGNVPKTVHLEIRRLKLLFRERCKGPYDKTEAKLGLAFFVQGVDEIKPMNRSGVRVAPFRKNAIGADIYVRQADWDAPAPAFRIFLWRSADEAVWACVERLRKHNVAIDEERLRRDLLLIRNEFLGDDLKSLSEDSIATTKTTPEATSRDDEERQVVVQYRIDGLARANDVDKRHSIENLLGQFLEEAGLGSCDGGDIGSGAMNIFCLVKPGRKAAKAIIEILRKNNFLKGAVIAEGAVGEEKIVWPPGFKGEFQLIEPA